MLPNQPSLLLNLCFVVLTLLVSGLFLAAIRHATSGARDGSRTWAKAAAGTGAWVTLTGGLATAGVLDEFSIPPRLPVLVVISALVISRLCFSTLGDRLVATLPAWGVVGSQAFRLPLELTMHRAYDEGVMPVQMSYSGWNFDIATGIAALVVAAARLTLSRRSRGQLAGSRNSLKP